MKEIINHIAVLFFFWSGVCFWARKALRMGWRLANSDVLVWRNGKFRPGEKPQPSEHEADAHALPGCNVVALPRNVHRMAHKRPARGNE